jgi:hypothetical protein
MKAWLLRLQVSLLELPPEQLPLLLSVGLVLGVFPLVGIPTVLCLLAAFALRLNVAALQILNSVTSPLQLALLLPLAHVGEKLCGGAAPAGSSWTVHIGSTALHAVTGWACVCIPFGAILYLALLLALPRPVRVLPRRDREEATYSEVESDSSRDRARDRDTSPPFASVAKDSVVSPNGASATCYRAATGRERTYSGYRPATWLTL